MNSIVVSGYITRDPEVRYTNTGKPVTTFTVGAKRLMGKEVQTDFIDFAAWGSPGENIAKFFKKGDFILVRGYLTVKAWKDNEGKGHKAPEVIVQEWSFGGRRAETPTESAEEDKQEAQAETVDDGFVPF
ncbi:MAG: single-stranded DNA-binding protein [Clostridia bacterium]|nr:single-stranded DNA-binding protein [Clostridia bacterium]